MKEQLSVFNLLLLLGITQGLITSVLLITSKKNKRSNLFLALGLIAFCFLSVKMLWHTLGLWDTTYIRYFPNAVEVVIAPLFYFFIVFLLNSNVKFSWKHALHFSPFAVSQTFAFVVYFSTLQTDNIPQKDAIADKLLFDQVKHTEDYLGLLSAIIYIILIYFRIRAYKHWLNNNTADSSYPDFNWLRKIFVLALGLGVFLFVNHFMDVFFDLKSSYYGHWEAFYLFLAFLVYYLGFVGYKQPHIEVSIDQIRDTEPSSSNLSSKEIDDIAQHIKNAMNHDKLFLNPTLSLYEFAKKLGINRRSLSRVINQKFQKSFRELINEYRIEEVKKQLQIQDLKQLSILGIALECGFNSEASFYRIFKKHTGMSPKEFLQKKST